MQKRMFAWALALAAAVSPGQSHAHEEGKNIATAPGHENLKYLALGDSYTIGEGVPDAGRWPVQLATRVEMAGFDFAAVEIIAQTGWTTDELKRGIEAVAPEGPYDLVSLLIGVNDQYRGRSVDAYRKELSALLDMAVAFAGGNRDRVFVVSIPDWGVTPFAEGRDREAIADQIDQYNAAKRAMCETRDIRFVPITDITRDTDSEPGLLAADGLHPSGRMYQRWVDERIATVALDLLH